MSTKRETKITQFITEKALDKIQHPFVIKPTKEIEIK